jgi:amidophosphoribosyltransferase
LSIAGLGRAINAASSDARSLDDQAAHKFLHSEFCYGCMEKEGWPFDPITEANYSPERVPAIIPASTITKRQ